MAIVPSAVSPQSSFVIFSLNIWCGGAGRYCKNADKTIQKDYPLEILEPTWQRIANLIATNGAYIVLLQEVDYKTKRCKSIDVPEKIRELLLQKKQPFRFSHFSKAIDYDEGEYGLATLSRFPRLSFQVWNLGNGKEKEERIAICESYRLPNIAVKVKFYVINVHLGLTKKGQQSQLEKLMKKVEKISPKRPIIMCGDFNIPGDGIGLPELMNRLKGQKRVFIDIQTKGDVTFPKDGTKIDYAFFCDALEKDYRGKLDYQCEVIKAADCSDHHALKLTVKLKKP